MSLNIKHPDAGKLARTLAHLTGESITETVIKALRERLTREEAKSHIDLKSELLKISEHCAALPDIDPRDPNQILGY